LPIRYEWIESPTAFYETNNSHYEKTDNSYFCIFSARHDARLVREPARDNRNDDATGYDKYGAYVHVTVATVGRVSTVFAGAWDYRQHLLSRVRRGSHAVTCTAVIRCTAC
jgi:hypothetical protein